MSRLETTRLALLPFTPNDLDYLHSLWTEPLVRRYICDDMEIVREQVQAVIETSQESFISTGFGFWRIDLKEDGRSIGFCGLRRFADQYRAGEQVEILYGLTATQWRKGFATEAANRVLQFGFEQTELRQFYAGADQPNTASVRVMERLGMSFDHQVEINGLVTHHYAITRDAYLTRQNLQ